MTISPFACASAVLSARALPPFSSVSRRTRGSSPNASATTAEVRSFDPSSITITSIATSVEASTPRTARSITRSSLYAGIITVTKRVGSIAGNTSRPSRRAWISARADSASARRMPTVIAIANIQCSATTMKPNALNSPRSTRAASWSLALIGGIDALRDRPARVETGTK